MLTHALNTPAPAVEDHPVAVRRPTLARIFALLTVVVAVASLGACTTSNSKTKGAQIVSNARAQIGDPYAYGAAGPNSFDCSGLVQYAHRLAGISTPRTSQAQAVSGRAIAKSAALPGDVIAIGTSHVGIYVGGGQMIDAPKAGTRVTQRGIWTGAYTVRRFW